MEGPDSTPATNPQTRPIPIEHLSGLTDAVEFYQRTGSSDSLAAQLVDHLDSKFADHTSRPTTSDASGPSSSD